MDGYLKPGHQVIDGGRAEVGGLSFGFAGAGLIFPYRTPNEIPQPEFAAKLDAIGAVDVVSTHIPARRSRAALRHHGPPDGNRWKPRCST